MRVLFELPVEIPLGNELVVQMLLENAKVQIIYRGTLTLVYIYNKNLFSKYLVELTSTV